MLILEFIRVWLWGVAAFGILSLQCFFCFFIFQPHDPTGSPYPPPFFSPFFYIYPPSSHLHSPWHYFWLRCSIRSRAPGSTSTGFERVCSGRPVTSWLRQQPKKRRGGGEKNERRSWNGLSLMTDNPVTNSWSSSKGWLSRLWLCDGNGTWSSGSAEAQRRGSQFSVCVPQTCPRLWFSSTHFDLRLSGLLSCCIFLGVFSVINKWIERFFFFFFRFRMNWQAKNGLITAQRWVTQAWIILQRVSY